jgi:hypothetical protein
MRSPSLKCRNSAISSTVATLEKPQFIGRFSAYELMEKLGSRYEWRWVQSAANPPPCFAPNIRVVFENNSEPSAKSVENACSTGISLIFRQFDIREEQGAPNCHNTERALASWEAGK